MRRRCGDRKVEQNLNRLYRVSCETAAHTIWDTPLMLMMVGAFPACCQTGKLHFSSPLIFFSLHFPYLRHRMCQAYKEEESKSKSQLTMRLP